MNNFDVATFQRLCRKAISYEQSARNPPPQLRPKALANKFSLTEAEVKTALSEMRANKPRLAGASLPSDQA